LFHWELTGVFPRYASKCSIWSRGTRCLGNEWIASRWR
jgi:hypothetical protein